MDESHRGKETGLRVDASKRTSGENEYTSLPLSRRQSISPVTLSFFQFCVFFSRVYSLADGRAASQFAHRKRRDRSLPCVRQRGGGIGEAQKRFFGFLISETVARNIVQERGCSTFAPLDRHVYREPQTSDNLFPVYCFLLAQSITNVKTVEGRCRQQRLTGEGKCVSLSEWQKEERGSDDRSQLSRFLALGCRVIPALPCDFIARV